MNGPTAFADDVAGAANSLRQTLLRDPSQSRSESDLDQSLSNTTAIVLGSGLGGLADKIDQAISVPYDAIPGFARSTAGGHRGQMIFGRIEDRPVIAMAGRFHRYEGWSNEQIAFPIHVMHALGARRLIASNAAGGVNPKLRVGDILVIRDHINWLHRDRNVSGHVSFVPQSPIAGIGNLNRGGVLYDAKLAQTALAAARGGGFTASMGSYLATLGPNYETRSEYRMMRRIGADVVGMSTVGEVLPASGLGMSVLALSVVSNMADPDRAIVADHSEVLEAGDAAAGKLEQIVRRVLRA